jgi:flagellar hook-basal body complex protein FliE
MHGQAYGVIPQVIKPIEAPTPTLHGGIKLDQVSGGSFGETLGLMVSKANNMMSAPETLAIDAVTTGKTDIHEVMVAMGKSEVAFKLITSLTQKMVGGMEKLISMQV